MENSDDFVIENGVLKKYRGSDTHVTIPDGVTSIGIWAFYGCESLFSVSIPDSVTSIGGGAFEDCSSLTSVSIPDGVTSIGGGTFEDCSSLSSVSIPDSVTSIGNSAFENCTNLTSVSVPDSVTVIGKQAFKGCLKLADDSGMVIIKNIVFDCKKDVSSVSIPSNVTVVSDSAFEYCKSLTSVSVPDSVTSIGDSVFKYCTSLASVSIPNSVTSIGDCAFEYCKSLASVSIPTGMTSIGNSVFRDCTSLASVSIPNGVTSIGDCAFEYCKSLASVSVPDSITSIGDSAFRDCTSLASFSIPNGVTSIGDSAFMDCRNLSGLEILSKSYRLNANAFNGTNLPRMALPEGAVLVLHANRDQDFIFDLPDDYPLRKDACDLCIKSLWDRKGKDLTRSFRIACYLAGGTVMKKKVESWADGSEKNALLEDMLEVLKNRKEKILFNKAASFAVLYNKSLSEELLRRLYDVCVSVKAEKAAKLLQPFLPEGKAAAQADSTPTGRLRYYCDEHFGSEMQVNRELRNVDLRSDVSPVTMAETGEPGDSYFVKCIMLAYAEQDRLHFDETVDYIASQLDRKELVKNLYEMTNTYSYMKPCYNAIYACARYADEEMIRNLIKVEKETKADRYDTDNLKLAGMIGQAILLNDTGEALRFAVSRKKLAEYARIRGKSEVEIQTALTGLDRNGRKVYDLGGKTVTVSLGADLKLTLTDSEGNILKSIPARGSDPELAKKAKEDFTTTKKTVQAWISENKENLYRSFLKGNEWKTGSWKKAWINDNILRRLAALVVWQQGDCTFIPTEDGFIRADGSAFSLQEKLPVKAAHPSEINEETLTAWRRFLITHRIRQPFVQMWEPAYDLSTPEAIETHRKRMIGLELPLYAFRGLDAGFCSNYTDGRGPVQCNSREQFRIHDNGYVSGLTNTSIFYITEIELAQGRKSSHLLYQLDKVAAYRRIAQDDGSIADYFSVCSPAQIENYLSVAIKEKATQCTALLLQRKNEFAEQYGMDNDPMDEFVLDF